MDDNFIEFLRERFRYYGGKVFYREAIGTKIKAGDRAGSITVTESGYTRRSIEIDGKSYPQARIIWMLHYGLIPGNIEVDHINRDSLCDLLSNLRLGTRSQNIANSINRKTSSSSSGVRGVTWNKKSCKWFAKIGYNGRRIHIGVYTSLKQAAIDYNAVAKALFGEFAILNDVNSIREDGR